jgi:hypothetical protein
VVWCGVVWCGVVWCVLLQQTNACRCRSSLDGGDHEEHAHLLAGFFLELGQEVSCCVLLSLASTRGALKVHC